MKGEGEMEENFYEMYLEDLSGIEPLGEEERVSLLRETALGSSEARGRLVEGSLSRVLELVREYEEGELPISDLIQEGNTALMLAAVEYDGTEGWEELLRRRVKEGVELALEEQKTQMAIEENVTARVNVLQRVSRVLAGELGREATLEELAAKMKMEPDEVKDIMKMTLDALTIRGENVSDPIKDGWSLEE